MIAPPNRPALGRNLIQTYMILGSAVRGANTWVEEGFCACTGPLEHAVCNFAMDLSLDPASTARLVEIARGHKNFRVYSLPDQFQEPNHDLLSEFGFGVTHSLVQMRLQRTWASERSGLQEALELQDRRRVASFMAEQFFSKQAYRYRRGIVEATTNAPDLRLFRIENDGRIEAAAMISEQAGVIGIYNLCVEATLRRKGLGTSVVRDIALQASTLGLTVTLQCEPRLVRWYEDNGFVDAGEVTVYGLCGLRDVAIMGA